MRKAEPGVDCVIVPADILVIYELANKAAGEESAMSWAGIFPAVTTKFTADDRLDVAEMERSFALQVDAGVHGLIVCGSLGEASTLDPEEKIEVLKTALRVTGGKIPVLLTVVDGATRRAQALAEAGAEAGAAGIRCEEDCRTDCLGRRPSEGSRWMGLT